MLQLAPVVARGTCPVVGKARKSTADQLDRKARQLFTGLPAGATWANAIPLGFSAGLRIGQSSVR